MASHAHVLQPFLLRALLRHVLGLKHKRGRIIDVFGYYSAPMGSGAMTRVKGRGRATHPVEQDVSGELAAEVVMRMGRREGRRAIDG